MDVHIIASVSIGFWYTWVLIFELWLILVLDVELLVNLFLDLTGFELRIFIVVCVFKLRLVFEVMLHFDNSFFISLERLCLVLAVHLN
jgi:hypothetical protein